MRHPGRYDLRELTAQRPARDGSMADAERDTSAQGQVSAVEPEIVELNDNQSAAPMAIDAAAEKAAGEDAITGPRGQSGPDAAED